MWTDPDSVDSKGIVDALRKGENECIKPRAGDAELCLQTILSEELHELVKRGILMEVARVKAHRTKKEKDKMTQLERFVTEGNEKADELAKAGAMLDEGFVAEVRADAIKQEREGEGVRSFATCSQLSLLSRTLEGL